MRFETFIALRYLLGKRKNCFISLITLISVAGVSVGVIALIVVMSVMTGFDNALRATIIGNRAHLTVEDWTGTIAEPEAMMAKLESVAPEILASSPIVQVEALLVAQEKEQKKQATGALVIGVDPAAEERVTQLGENLSSNSGRTYGRGVLPKHKEIVLGYLLAERIGVEVGDEIQIITNKERVSPFGMRSTQSLWVVVSGISQAQMSEFDSLYAYVDLDTARLLTGRDGVDAIHCKIDNPFDANMVAGNIQRELGYRTTTWYESQQAFFDALKQEKLAMFIILAFIILVAAFNITSTLIMVVMEKRRDVGIMRTLGVSGFSIVRVFMLEGLAIGLGGTVLGVISGAILAYNINPVAEFIAGLFGLDLFNSQIYYFDRIPVAVVWWDIGWITIASVVLTFLSTLYPAWSAARVQPVEAIRYE